MNTELLSAKKVIVGTTELTSALDGLMGVIFNFSDDIQNGYADLLPMALNAMVCSDEFAKLDSTRRKHLVTTYENLRFALSEIICLTKDFRSNEITIKCAEGFYYEPGEGNETE